MNFTGIDRITYGVADMDECVRFFDDWGLRRESLDGSGAVFRAEDDSEVVLRNADDPGLPPAFESGPTLRSMVWGVASDADLAAVRERLQAAGELTELDGQPACVDPNGLAVAFRVTRRRAVQAPGATINTWDRPDARTDAPSTFYDRAVPMRIGHVVLFVADVARAETFYTERLGFRVSDRYPGAAVFLRCKARGGHHDLFLLETPKKQIGLNHVAFTVRDIHEVFGGGLHIDRRGWKTQLGPGRHPISSAYFWYVHNPCGALAEYFADEDYVTERWQPREFERSNEVFAEWAIGGGIDGNTRRQRS